jgi:hypothetical protein
MPLATAQQPYLARGTRVERLKEALYHACWNTERKAATHGAGTHTPTRYRQRIAGQRSAAQERDPRSTPRTLGRPQSLYRVHVHSHVHNAGVALTHALQRGIQVVQHTTAMDEAHGVHAQPSLALRLRGHGRGGGAKRQGHRRSSGARPKHNRGTSQGQRGKGVRCSPPRGFPSRHARTGSPA